MPAPMMRLAPAAASAARQAGSGAGAGAAGGDGAGRGTVVFGTESGGVADEPLGATRSGFGVLGAPRGRLGGALRCTSLRSPPQTSQLSTPSALTFSHASHVHMSPRQSPRRKREA